MSEPMDDASTIAPKAASVELRPVTVSDVLAALAAGLRDFRAAPQYGLFLAGVYAVGGWILALLLLWFDLPFLVYPLAAGFALVAPFIATGFYAVSRCLERGEPLTWAHFWAAIKAATGRELGWMALVTGFSFFIWMDIAALLFFGMLGLQSWSLGDLLREIFTTPTGLLFLILGNAAGALIALGVFSISVVSFPLLFDREVDFVTAMVTSVKLVLANPVPMVFWCAVIAILIGLSILSGLVALFLVLPLLGHGTWHIYRRAVAPSD